LTKSLSKQQKEAIRSYVKKGYSANQIQVNLKNRHMGIRRKMLLAEVRRAKNQPKKPNTVKYIPKKYVKARWLARAELERILETKQVTVEGKHKGDFVSKTRRGKGKDLYNFVRDEMTGDYWDEKPSIHS
jgi:hypothetical protein